MSTIPTRALRTGVELSTLGFGGAPFGRAFRPCQRNPSPRHPASGLERRHPLLRHRPVLRLWQKRAPPRPLSPPAGAQGLRAFDQGSAGCSRPPATLDSFEKGFWVGGLPFDFRFDYGYDGIMRSWEDSLQRLSLNSIDLLLIHGPRQLLPRQRAALLRPRQPPNHQRLARPRRAALAGADQGRRRGPQPHGGHAAPARRSGPGLLYRRHALYAHGPKSPLDEEFPLCEERDVRHRHRRGLRFRHPRHRPRSKVLAMPMTPPRPKSSQRPAASKPSASGTTCPCPAARHAVPTWEPPRRGDYPGGADTGAHRDQRTVVSARNTNGPVGRAKDGRDCCGKTRRRHRRGREGSPFADPSPSP